ncbi:MAG: methyltransferase domain-containing protein [Alphaproteobacteria bacterium]|nr:methyltransferase domain-containing protein [Alphaproteobacteria bacterium]
MDRRKELATSWERNADNWAHAVRRGLIPSRKAGTDQVIVHAVANRNPSRILDVGCGEGFYLRTLAAMTGCTGVGIDGSIALIEKARAADPINHYAVLTYEDLIADPTALEGPFDAILFNYALFDEDIAPLLSAVKRLLTRDGAILIQTLHPWAVSDGDDYRDGWRTEDFSGIGGDGWTPMPWYFRTMASWHTALRDAGLSLIDLAEPTAEPGVQPLSLLMTCEPTTPAAR